MLSSKRRKPVKSIHNLTSITRLEDKSRTLMMNSSNTKLTPTLK